MIDTVHLSSVADPALIQIEKLQNRLTLRHSGTVRKLWTFDQQPTAISTRWQGTYNASIEYGPMEEGIYASINYSIYVGPDSCTFSGIGYRTYFTDLCRADDTGNELKLYFVKALEGDGFPDHSNQSLLGTLFIRDGSYFFKSPLVAEASWNYNIPIPVRPE